MRKEYAMRFIQKNNLWLANLTIFLRKRKILNRKDEKQPQRKESYSSNFQYYLSLLSGKTGNLNF